MMPCPHAISRLSPLFLLLLSVGGPRVATDRARLEPPRCSKAQAFEFLPPEEGGATQRGAAVPRFWLDSTATLLLGRASPDTLVAGEGRVIAHRHPLLHAEHPTVFGQRVRLQRVAGANSASLATAISTHGFVDAVLVPWDYDASCSPWFWSGSALWTTPGLTALYVATLRPDSLSVAGQPTFDVYFAALRTYAPDPRAAVAHPPAVATPEQAFEHNARAR